MSHPGFGFALALSALTLSGCATLEQRATTAAVADGATTAIGLSLGLAEMNPLGAAFAVGVKLPMLAWVSTWRDDEQAEFHAVAGPVWSGVTASNVCMVAAALTHGIFAPVCLAAGAAFGWQQWSANREERDFYIACNEYRRHSGEAFRCVYRLVAQQ